MTPTSNICFNYKLHGRQVYDSRGKPTVEAEIELSDGTKLSTCYISQRSLKGAHIPQLYHQGHLQESMKP